jgi:hypothetical protein
MIAPRWVRVPNRYGLELITWFGSFLSSIPIFEPVASADQCRTSLRIPVEMASTLSDMFDDHKGREDVRCYLQQDEITQAANQAASAKKETTHSI